MKHTARMIRLLLVLALMLGLMVLPAHAAAPTTLYVGDTNVVAGGFWLNNDGSLTTEGASETNYNVRYDKAGTLYLKGANIKKSFNGNGKIKGIYGIYADGDLKIVLEADSVVDISATTAGVNDYNCALYCSGSLTIQGTGKLTLTGGKGYSTFGIYIPGSEYDLTVESGVEVTATAGTATGMNSCGVELGNSNIICRGTLTGNGGSASGSDYSQSAGIYTGGQIEMDGGTLTGKGGKSTATSNIYGSYGVRADAISGTGTVTAISGEAPNGGLSCGYHTGDNSAYVKVSKLRLIAQGGDYGIYMDTTYGLTGSFWLTASGGVSAVEGPSSGQMKFVSGTGEKTLYERKSANGEFTQVSKNSILLNKGQITELYYELVVDHAHTMGSYSSDAVNHWSTCTGDDYGTCPMDYEEKVAHTLNENNTCVCGLEAVASVTTADGSTVSYYQTLGTAITAAQQSANSTVKLLEDFTEPEDAYYGFTVNGGNFTLDLNGKKINVPSDYGLYVCEATKLSITDSSEDKTGTISAKDYAVSAASGGAAVTIEGGTYNKVSVSADCSLEIRDGVFQNAEAVSVHSHNANLTITGGTFTGPQPAIGFDLDNGEYSGKTEISGGTFVGGLKITKYGTHQDNAPTAAEILAEGYAYFNESGIAVIPAADAMTTGTETVTVKKQAALSIALDKELYYKDDGTIKVTITTQQEELSGWLYTYIDGQKIDQESYSVSGGRQSLTNGKVYTKSLSNIAPGDHEIYLVFVPDDETMAEGQSNTVAFHVGKIPNERLTNHFTGGETEVTYDGTVKAADVCSIYTAGANNFYLAPESYTLTYWQDSVQVENPTNAGTYTVKLTMAENDYYEAATDYEMGTLVITPAAPGTDHLNYTLPDSTVVYTGKAFAAAVSVKEDLEFGELTVIYLDSEGSESEIAPVNPGTYTVFACIEASNNNTEADVDLGSFTISKATPDVSLSLSESETSYEDIVTFEVKVSGPENGVIPTGTVKIYNGSDEIASGNLEDGRFTATADMLPVGDYSFTAAYTPAEDAPYSEADPEAATLKVNPKAVALNVSDTDHTYDGTRKTVTFTTNTNLLSTENFTVTYYLVDENMGTVSKVNRAVSVGKYLYVVELEENANYTFADPITMDGNTLPEGTYDNAGFMTIAVKMPESQQHIYFTEGSASVYITDGTYCNTLVNPNTGATVTYTSSNEAVAEVDEAGQVTLKKEGTVTIIATSEKNNTTPVTASYTLTVAKKTVTVKLAEGTTVIYGGNLPTADDLTNSENLSYADLGISGTLSFAGYTVGQGVGTYYITPAGITSSKYHLVFEAAALTVAPKTIEAIVFTAADKYYDGTDSANIVGVSVYGALDADQISAEARLNFNGVDAGMQTVSVSDVKLTGADAGNYAIGADTIVEAGTANIARVEVSILCAETTTRTFDGKVKRVDVSAMANGAVFTGYRVSYTADGVPAEPVNAGTYDVVITLSDTTNYSLAPYAAQLIIEPAAQGSLSIQGIPEHVYYGDSFDISVPGEVSYEIMGSAKLDGNTVSATDVGSVTITATVTAKNYDDQIITKTFIVQPRVLTPTAEAKNRIYNGESWVDVEITLSNVVSGDTVTATAVGEMATADAGDKLVYVTDIALDEAATETGRYVLSDTGLQTRVQIDPITIGSVSGVEADSKTYDGTAEAVARIFDSEDILDADKADVTIHGTASFEDPNAGTAKTVTVKAKGLGGSKANNYVLAENVTAEAAADILPAEVFFEINETVFIYDGEPKSVTVTAECDGQSFEDFTVDYDSDERIDTGEYTVTVTLNDDRNYTGAPEPFVMVIEPDCQDELIISGMPGVIDYGRQFKLTAYAEEGAVVTWSSSDETVATVDENGNVTILDVDREVTITAIATKPDHLDQVNYVTFTPVAKQVSFHLSGLNTTYNGKTQSVTVAPSVEGMTDYTVTYTDEDGNAVTPVDAGVYYVEVSSVGNKYEGYAAGTLTINKAKLTGSVSMEGWTYGESAKAPGYTLSVEGITPTYTYSGTGIKDGVPCNAGTYTVTATFTADNYETLTVSADFEVKKAALTITAADAARAYGAGDPVFAVTYVGFVNGDDDSALLVLPTARTEAAADADVGTYPITAGGGRAENYDFVYVDGTMTVTPAKAVLTITGCDHELSVGDTAQLHAYAGGQEVQVKWTSSDESVATVDEKGNVTIHMAGDVAITAELAEGNYAAATATFSVHAGKKTVTLTPKTTVFTFNGQVQAVEFMTVDGFTPVVGQNVKVRYTMSTDASVTTFRDTGTYSVVYEIDDPAYQGSGVVTVYMNPAQSEDSETLCPSRRFTDIEKDVWYHEGVDYVVANGMMNGVSDTLFAPNMNTSRGMIVTVLYRMEGSPEAGECPFDDVKPGSYYEKAIAWAAANGVVNGYSAESFGPDDPITREQMAVILYRYAAYKGCDVSASADLSVYTDAGRISRYAVEAMSWANAEGLINGKSATVLDPTGGAKRCEVATILMRFCKNLAE